jgi:hypothetical protein
VRVTELPTPTTQPCVRKAIQALFMNMSLDKKLAAGPRCEHARWKMSEAHALSTPELSEPLTWQEICRRYPDQWVALVDIAWVDEDEVRGARVAGHGPRRADPLEQARHLHSRYEEIGHFFTGRVRAPLRGYFAP